MGAASGVKTEDRAVAAGRWGDGFSRLMRHMAGRFACAEPCRRVGKFVRGPLAGLSWKDCWVIAERGHLAEVVDYADAVSWSLVEPARGP